MNKISIVIPVYNGEARLKVCFDSIINSTYKNIEAIVVDDGSTDSTKEIIKEYEAKDSRFTAFSIKHSGVSAARNYGLKQATGEYLMFCDSDDTLDPLMLEKMIKMLEDNDADLAVCRFNHPFFKTYCENEVFDLTDPNELLRFYEDTYGMVMPWNRICKRECFTEEFDVDVHFSEDELGNLANLPNVKKAVTTNEYLYNYYIAQKENKEEETSCVNNIINSVAFWNNNSSFYYLGASIVPKRAAAIQKGIDEGKLSIKDVNDMKYLRLIDYAFWQMPAYIGMGIPEYGLSAECRHIFDDKDFIDGFKAQEKYGYRLKDMSKEEKDYKTAIFTNLCYKTYKDNSMDESFRVAYAFISIFLRLFMEETGKLDLASQNARLLNDLKNNSTKEAKYVNSLIN